MRPLKSGTSTSIVVSGLSDLTLEIHSAKCVAPLSFRSSRSTDVTTTYLRPISCTASASCPGSSWSSSFGLPCATSQNGQRRVQISPMIINVAVPCEKHSGKLGQLASSQTDASFLRLRISLIRVISGLVRIRTRIQSGFRSKAVVGMTLTGIRRTLSAPLSFSPGTMRFLSTIRAFSIWDRHHTRFVGPEYRSVLRLSLPSDGQYQGASCRLPRGPQCRRD